MMAAGVEHYQEAERLLTKGRGVVTKFKGTSDPAERESLCQQAAGMWAEAQVHATLALAASIALTRADDMYVADAEQWETAASAFKPGGEP